MKITIHKPDLTRALDGLLRAAKPHKAVRLNTDDAATLSLTVAEEKMTMVTKFPAQVHEKGSINLPLKLLTDLINAMPSHEIELEQVEGGLDKDGPALAVNVTGHSAFINGYHHFPKFASFTPSSKRKSFGEVSIPVRGNTENAVLDGMLKINGQIIREINNLVVPMAATEDSRPVLSGVEISVKNESVHFVAADGFRLSNLQYDNLKMTAPKGQEPHTLLRADALKKAGQIIGHGQDAVDILFSTDARHAVIRVGNTDIIVAGLLGDYPNHQQISSPEITSKATLSALALRFAVQTASLFAEDHGGALKLTIEPLADGVGQVVIMGRSTIPGNYETSIEAKTEGARGEVFLDRKYLVPILEHAGGKSTLEISSLTTPCLIRQTNEGAYDLLHVIMPMLISPKYF